MKKQSNLQMIRLITLSNTLFENPLNFDLQILLDWLEDKTILKSISYSLSGTDYTILSDDKNQVSLWNSDFTSVVLSEKQIKHHQQSAIEYNQDIQYYKDLPLRQIVRGDYHVKRARRFVIADTNQNVWIPLKHLYEDGTIKNGQQLDYIFAESHAQLKKAGYKMAFVKIEQK